MEIADKMRVLIEALRSSPQRPPNAKSRGPAGVSTPSGRPLDQRRRGYQLYAQEAQTNGEDPMSYEEWISSQE